MTIARRIIEAFFVMAALALLSGLFKQSFGLDSCQASVKKTTIIRMNPENTQVSPDSKQSNCASDPSFKVLARDAKQIQNP